MTLGARSSTALVALALIASPSCSRPLPKPAPATARARPAAPEPPPDPLAGCTPGERSALPAVLSTEQAEIAADALLAEDLEPLAAALAVPCFPGSPGHRLALAQHVARFELRHRPAPEEADGLLDPRTRRYLALVFAALRAEDAGCADDPTLVPACLLTWQGASAEQLSFMRRVFVLQRALAARRRPFVLAATDVAPIEPGSSAHPRLAAAASALLIAARAARPTGAADLRVANGYRSACFQFEIWEHHFPARYAETTRTRARLRSGPHGDAAVASLARYYARRTAAPGHSNHQSGLAIDFTCLTPDQQELLPTVRFARPWRASWCYAWLREHAASFGLRELRVLDEPWHWELAPDASLE